MFFSKFVKQIMKTQYFPKQKKIYKYFDIAYGIKKLINDKK